MRQEFQLVTILKTEKNTIYLLQTVTLGSRVSFSPLFFSDSRSFHFPRTLTESRPRLPFRKGFSRISPPKSHPIVAPYSLFEMNFTRQWKAEENGSYFTKGNTMQGLRFRVANWKLPLTSRLNLLWMSAREQIRVKSTIRDGNCEAVKIQTISSIKLKTSLISFSAIYIVSLNVILY